MGADNTGSNNNHDQIIGDKLILYDRCEPGEKILKRVEIHTVTGEVKNYQLKRTKKGGYLFN